MTRDMHRERTKFINEAKENSLLPLMKSEEDSFYYVTGTAIGNYIIGYKTSLYPNNNREVVEKLRRYTESDWRLLSTFSVYLSEHVNTLCDRELLQLLVDDNKIVLPVCVVKDKCIAEVDAAWSALSKFFAEQTENE